MPVICPPGCAALDEANSDRITHRKKHCWDVGCGLFRRDRTDRAPHGQEIDLRTQLSNNVPNLSGRCGSVQEGHRLRVSEARKMALQERLQRAAWPDRHMPDAPDFCALCPRNA